MGGLGEPLTPTGACGICGNPVGRQALWCARCKKLLSRHRSERKFDRNARIQALKAAWDANAKGFLCHYTKVLLEEENNRSPRYISFDHRVPRRESDVVVAAALVNDMKSDLTEEEFRALVVSLARTFETKSRFDERLFEAKHYRR